jgi:hydrophobic/amphiphilic exporter-1 (mainly G- bacteria), HAE1 family
MFLAKLAVHRPVLTTTMILLFVVIGFRGYSDLSQELFPNIEFPFVMVQTIYPGAGPKEVESQITRRIEDEVFSVSNLEKMNSRSSENLSFIFLQFELGADEDLKAIEVKDKIERIRADLPDGAEPPAVFKYNPTEEAVMQLAVSSPRSLEETFRITDEQIKDQLAKVEGVSSVDIVGGREREIRVALNRYALQSYGLSVADVLMAIASENIDFPVGRIITGQKELSLRLQAKFKNLDELRNVLISTPHGTRVYVRDVATVIDTFAEPRSQARFQGREAVSLEVQKKSEGNAVEISAEITKAIADLSEVLPRDIKIEVVQDSAEYIVDSINDATTSILIGILLTAGLLWLFLHDLRATFIASISIPAAIMGTFMPMMFAGFTLNMISLMGLGVSVGVLVANAIVVLESISLHIDRGQSADDAAINGTTSVAIAVIASTATNLVVFTPIAFMKGIVGQFFKQFGLTVVFATMFSLFMSFTLVPMLAARLYRTGGKKHELGFVKKFGDAWDAGYNNLADSFKNSISWSLRHRWVIALVAIAAFAGGMMLFGFIGSELFPESDRNMVNVAIKLPAGTSLQKSDEVFQEIDERMRERFGDAIVSSLQSVGGTLKGVGEGNIIYKLTPAAERNISAKQIADRARPTLAGIPSAEISVGISESGPGQGLQIEITGEEIDQLNAYAGQLMGLMKSVEGLVDVRSDYVTGKPELTFIPDREQMAAYGVNTAMIGQVLRIAFEGEVRTRYKEGDEEYDIRVQLDASERDAITDFEDMFIRIGTNYIPLSQLGDFQLTSAETEINRKNKRRMITVSGNVSTGTLGEKQTALQALIDENMEIAQGDGLHFGGQAEFMAETFQYILEALILAIILTYMVLAAVLESFVHPFTIMLTLPLGLIGVSLSLFLSGISLNMMSLMAVVMLVGIVVNNAILILDRVTQLRLDGLEVREALVEAAGERLRPIMMMNIAIAVSLVPQVMGSGAEFRAAIAMVTIGGVLVSTFFTLYLIPCVYTAFDRFAGAPKRTQ